VPDAVATDDAQAIVCSPTQPPCGECKGKVSELTLQYTGTTPNAQIRVVQKNGATVFDGVVQPDGTLTFTGTDNGTLGTDITVYVNGVLNASIHTSCSQPIGPGLKKGDFLVVSGKSLEGGPLCPLPPQPDCGACSGKVSQLTLQYTGTIVDAMVRVVQKNGAVVFNNTVQPNGTFTINGTDNGTLTTDIYVYVNGTQNASIHTSCSQPIGPGLVRGDFLVVEGYSLNGGKLCEMQTFSIVKIEKHSPVEITWESKIGASYQIQYLEKLGASAWTTVGTVLSQGPLTTWVDPDPARVDRLSGFYRVILVP
jgi:hypothetical protein